MVLILPRRKTPEPVPEPVPKPVPAPATNGPAQEEQNELFTELFGDDDESLSDETIQARWDGLNTETSSPAPDGPAQELQTSQSTDSHSDDNEPLSEETLQELRDGLNSMFNSAPTTPPAPASSGKKRKAQSDHQDGPEQKRWAPIPGAPIHTQNKPIGPNAVAAHAMGASAHRHPWMSNTQETDQYYATGMPADPARNQKKKRRTETERHLDEWKRKAAISRKASAKEAAKAEIEALEETHRAAVNAVYEKYELPNRLEKPRKRRSRSATKKAATPPQQPKAVIDLTGDETGVYQPVQQQRPPQPTAQGPSSSSLPRQAVPPAQQQAPPPFVQPGAYFHRPEGPYGAPIPFAQQGPYPFAQQGPYNPAPSFLWQGPYQAAPHQSGVAPSRPAPAPVAVSRYQGPPRTIQEMRAREELLLQQQALERAMPQTSQGSSVGQLLPNMPTVDEEWESWINWEPEAGGNGTPA